MTKWEPTVQNCDNYMDERTGKYEYRAVRYRAAIEAMIVNGLDLENDTIFDIGAGMTEFDYCLRVEYNFRGRYIPIDGGIGGKAHDLNYWTPNRDGHWFVALEILEHLVNWEQLVQRMQHAAIKGIVISTPNPETTDVIGMDPTHVTEVWPAQLEKYHFTVSRETFYGGIWSNGDNDSLLGVWIHD